MSLIGMIEEEDRVRKVILDMALTDAVTALWKCSPPGICKVCNSDCYTRQVKKQCDAYKSKAESTFYETYDEGE